MVRVSGDTQISYVRAGEFKPLSYHQEIKMKIKRREFIKKVYKVPVLIVLGSLLPKHVEGGSSPCYLNPAGQCPPGKNK